VLDDKASVGAVFEDDARNFILTPVDGGYNVYVAGESALTVTVYDMAGRAVAAVSADGNTADITTASLHPGVYIVAAQGKTQQYTAKIIVK
ncbi:MAG: T9SS type A sorting domain-containing protein, partial [Muribaculaceae bacterium]|nr:T9SS type A sorting domain-containing protein [Muribaculaceae bacterium]